MTKVGTVQCMETPSMFIFEVGVLREHQRVGEYYRTRGVPVDWCSLGTLRRGRYPLDRSVLVAGSVQFVHAALDLLAVPRPAPLGFPHEITPWLGRVIRTMSAADARECAARDVVFVKPSAEVKRFTGGLTSDPEIADTLRRLPPDVEVFVSDVVEFVAEWRCFVVHGEVRAIAQYEPDDELRTVDVLPPLMSEITAVAAAAAAGCTSAAFSVDVGRLADGALAVVELNDGYALGAYGISPAVHAELLWERWQQLVC